MDFGADNALSVKYNSNRMLLVILMVLFEVSQKKKKKKKKKSFKSLILWCVFFYMILCMYITLGQGRTACRGQKFDSSRKRFTLQLFVVSIIKVTFDPDFI